jgi:asparagine synthase (glutamine-hydrolysing)
MEGTLPTEVLWRKKSPYPKTWDPAYLHMVADRLQDVLADPNAPILQIISFDALQQLLADDYPWPWYGQLMRRPQTIVYMLQINYWLEHYSVRIV